MIDRILTSFFCSNVLIGNHVSPTHSSGLSSTEFETSVRESPNNIEDDEAKENRAKDHTAKGPAKSVKHSTNSNSSSSVTTITPLAIAVVLGSGAVGTKQEYAWLENLDRVSSQSSIPKTFVHNLGLSIRSKKSLCDEGRYALVLAIEYRNPSKIPVLSIQDCQFGRELSARTIDVVTQIDLIGDIWSEHQTLSRIDLHSNRRFTLNRRLRDGFIAGGAVLVVGGAIAIVFAATLRKQQAVLRVSPDVPSRR